MNYEFNMLHHVGVVAKSECAAEEEMAHGGDDNIFHSGPTGRGVKSDILIVCATEMIMWHLEYI